MRPKRPKGVLMARWVLALVCVASILGLAAGFVTTAASEANGQLLLPSSPQASVAYRPELCARVAGTWNVLWERIDAKAAASSRAEVDNPPSCLDLVVMEASSTPSLSGSTSTVEHLMQAEGMELVVARVDSNGCGSPHEPGMRLRLKRRGAGEQEEHPGSVSLDLFPPASESPAEHLAMAPVVFLEERSPGRCLWAHWHGDGTTKGFVAYLGAFPVSPAPGTSRMDAALGSQRKKESAASDAAGVSEYDFYHRSLQAGPSIFEEEQKLLPDAEAAWSYSGYSVSIDGGVVAVGAYRDDDLGSRSGSVYIFILDSEAVWSRTQKLLAADGSADDVFGFAVSVKAFVMVAGARWHRFFRGSAYVFTSVDSGYTWSQAAQLVASNPMVGDQFGTSVSLSGDIIVVGADGFGADPVSAGRALVFTTSDGGVTWPERAQVTASDGVVGDRFGHAVHLDGNTLVVGAPGANDGTGAAYIFTTSTAGASWAEVTKLLAAGGDFGHQFGFSVSVSGSIVVAGAPQAEAGLVYAFASSSTDAGTLWTQAAEISVPDETSDAEFGLSVCVSEAMLVVGASSWAFSQGRAYAFVSNNNGVSWTQTATLSASDGASNARFGGAVDISDSDVLVGAWGDSAYLDYAGSAYVFANAFSAASGPTDLPTASIANPSNAPSAPTLAPIAPEGDFIVTFTGVITTDLGDDVYDSAALRDIYRTAFDQAFCGLLGLVRGIFCVADAQASALEPASTTTGGSHDLLYDLSFDLSESVALAVDFPAITAAIAGDELVARFHAVVQDVQTLASESQLLNDLKRYVVGRLGAGVEGFTPSDAVEVTRLASVTQSTAATYAVVYREVTLPLLSAADLADDLTRIKLTFADGTNRFPWNLEPFSCPEVLIGAQLRAERCQWHSSTELWLILDGARSVLMPDDVLALRSDIALRCDGICDPGVAEGDVNEARVELSGAAVAPKVSIAYDPVVSVCGGKTSMVDLSASTRGGGRPFEVLWSIQSEPDPLPARLVDSISAAGETLTFLVEDLPITSGASATDAPAPGTFLGLEVTITNFAEVSTTAGGIDIVRVSNASYVAQIRGYRDTTIRIDRDTAFVGTVESACGAGSDLAGLRSEWQVRDAADVPVTVLDRSNVSTMMLLNAYPGLRPNETFEVVYQSVSVDAISGARTVEAEARVAVDVPTLPLGRRISGCETTATAFRTNLDTGRVELDADALHAIDASGSWDQNLGARSSSTARDAVTFSIRSMSASSGDPLAAASAPPTAQPTQTLSLQPTLSRRRLDGWHASQRQLQGGTACQDALPGAVLDQSTSSAKTISFRAAELQGCTVRLDLELRSSETSAPPVMQSCAVRFAGAAAPEIIIHADAREQVSSTKRLAIRASVLSADAPLTSRWTLLEGAFTGGASLDVVASTPVTATFPVPIEPADIPLDLVIGEAGLLERRTYTFELFAEFQPSAADTTAQRPAVAQITFTTNAAPTSGSFDVLPSFGTFATAFDLLAVGWEDADLPLAFKFRAAPREEGTSLLLNPTTTSINRLRDTLLPVGPASFFGISSTTLRLDVVDAVGVSTGRELTVRVEPPGSAQEALDAAAALLDDLEAQDLSNSDVDSVYTIFGSTASLISEALATGTSSSTTVLQARELQLRGVNLLGEAVAVHPKTPELFDSQAGTLQALSASPRYLWWTAATQDEAATDVVAVLAVSVLDVASLVLTEADSSTSVTAVDDAATGGSALGVAPAAALTGALSNVLGLGEAATRDRANSERVGDVAQELQRVRSASLLTNEAPEVLLAARVLSSSSIQFFNPLRGYELDSMSAATSNPSLKAQLGLNAPFLESLGVHEFERFLLGLVALDASALTEQARSGNDDLPNDTVESLVSGVHRLAINLFDNAEAKVSRVADDFASRLRGAFTFTLALSRDVESLRVEECDRLLGTETADEDESTDATSFGDDDPRSYVTNDGDDEEADAPMCDVVFACAAYNRERGAFQELEECTAEQLPADPALSPFGSVRCTCAFTSGLQRLLQSEDAEDGSTVSLDFGTLMRTSAGNVNNFRSFGEPQPVVLVAVIFFTIFFLIFAYLAERFDDEDREAQRASSEDELECVRVWMERCHFPLALVAKLLGDKPSAQSRCCASGATPAVRGTRLMSMEDIRLLKRQSWSEVADFSQEHGLSENEAQLLRLALATAGRGDLQLTKNAAGAAELAKVAGAADEAVDPRKLARALQKSPRLDTHFWYGLLLATPQRLLDYEDRSLSEVLWRAMKTRHDVFDALSLHAGDAPTRLVRVLYFATSTFATLFVTAVIYQVLYPADDDFCNDRNQDEATCEAASSQLNVRESRCYWQADATQCRPTEPDPTTSAVVVAAAFALIFMAPMAVFFRCYVNAFLSEAPPGICSLLQARKLRRKAILSRSEAKRAAGMQAEELAVLQERPEYRPWLLRRLWPRWLADKLMEVQVARAACHAAQLETDLDAERSTWPMHERCNFSRDDYADLVQEAMERKLLVTTVAVRDSLPWLKRLVFRSYTSFSVISEGTSQRTRYIAIAVMLAFDAFCIAYLLAFGANVTSDQALGWLVSFLLGEIIVVFLLIALRITILNVVMPALVRPDVTVERAVYNMPHFSAAGILARQRPALVPGLASVFDARFRVLEVAEEDAAIPPMPEAERRSPRRTMEESTELTQALKAGSFHALNARSSSPKSDDTEAPRDSTGSLTQLVMRLARRTSADPESRSSSPAPPMTAAGVPLGSTSSGVTRGGTFSRFSSSRKQRTLRQVPSLTVNGITDAYSTDSSATLASGGASTMGLRGSALSSTGARPHGSSLATMPNSVGSFMRETQEAFRHSHRFSSDASLGESDASETERSSRHRSDSFPSETSSGKRPEDYKEYPSMELGRLRSMASRTKTSATASSQRRGLATHGSSSESRTVLQEEHSDKGQDVHILDASKTLRRRNPVLKWSTRLLLFLFALVLIWPEPVQEFLLEEGIPVGLALVLLVGLRLDVSEGVEVLISFLTITAIALFGLLVVYFVSMEIARNLRAFGHLWRSSSGTAMHKTAPAADWEEKDTERDGFTDTS